jgi:hypothetical protein
MNSAASTPRPTAIINIADIVVSFHTRWRVFRRALRLKLERISDAVAEGEFSDMGFSRAAAKAAVVESLRLARGR